MTNSKPTSNPSQIRSSDIAPPPDLCRLWIQQAQAKHPRDFVGWAHHISKNAAQWGADQELEACCEWLYERLKVTTLTLWHELRAVRRPKPLSLKEQAIAELDDAVMRGDCITVSDALPTIRRALEALPND